jgi:hypothetical protein
MLDSAIVAAKNAEELANESMRVDAQRVQKVKSLIERARTISKKVEKPPGDKRTSKDYDHVLELIRQAEELQAADDLDGASQKAEEAISLGQDIIDYPMPSADEISKLLAQITEFTSNAKDSAAGSAKVLELSNKAREALREARLVDAKKYAQQALDRAKNLPKK